MSQPRTKSGAKCSNCGETHGLVVACGRHTENFKIRSVNGTRTITVEKCPKYFTPKEEDESEWTGMYYYLTCLKCGHDDMDSEVIFITG